jgi:hypothetical protein
MFAPLSWLGKHHDFVRAEEQQLGTHETHFRFFHNAEVAYTQCGVMVTLYAQSWRYRLTLE